MNKDKNLIKRATVAWHTAETTHICLPILATDGTHLAVVPFYREGLDWVAKVPHRDMEEIVKLAEEFNKERS